MMKRMRWGLVVGVLVLGMLALSVVKTIAAGPANLARAGDIAKAKADVPPTAGGDDRAPLGPDGYVSGNGIIEPADRETHVAGQSPGRVARIWVREGDVVEAGAPLVELDSATERAALDAAEAELAVEVATLTRTTRGLRREDVDALVGEAEAAHARAQMSADVLARTARLADTGAVTQDELDRSRRQAEADERTFAAADARRLGGLRGGRREDVAVGQAQVRAATARRDEALASLERLTVRAPIAGTILQLKYRAGEYYNPAAANGASAEPLVVLGDTKTLRARVDVDERDVARVKLGAAGYVSLSAFGDRRFPGKVVEVGRRMGRKNVRTDDPVERLDVKILEVLMQLDEPDGLLPGIRVAGYIASTR